jgi:SNF2 family DNA or RNA helicase
MQHTIRNSKSKIFLAVTKIRADRRLALTGTPFVNRALDVYSLLSFLGMEPLDNRQIFQRAISQPL